MAVRLHARNLMITCISHSAANLFIACQLYTFRNFYPSVVSREIELTKAVLIDKLSIESQKLKIEVITSTNHKKGVH